MRRRFVALATAVAASAALMSAALAGVTGDRATDRPTATDDMRTRPVPQQGVEYAHGRTLDIHHPRESGPSAADTPLIVLVHGCCGDRSDLGKLAEAIADAGAVVLNADWAGIDADAHYPDAYEDVACAVRFARAWASGRGTQAQRVTLVGWSDGALAASVVGLAGNSFDARSCRYGRPSARPDAVVGLAGFYGWPLPVPPEYVTPRARAFFGGTPTTARRAWESATPYAWLLPGGSGPDFRILVGTTHPLLPDARRYAAAMRDAGHRVRLVEMPPAGDQTLVSPRSPEGRQAVREVLAVARQDDGRSR